MMLRVHILSKELTYIKLKIVLCSLQDIHELMNFSCQPPTLVRSDGATKLEGWTVKPLSKYAKY